MKVMSVGFKGRPQQKGSAAAGEGKKESLLHTGGSEKTNWPKEQELGNPNYSFVVFIPGTRQCPADGPGALRWGRHF